MDHIVEVTAKLLRGCKASEIEVEARIRRQLINDYSVKRLIESFDGWETRTYSEKKKISKTNRKCTYRSRDGATICKSSISRSDVNDAWCAVHVSVETPVPSMQHVLEAVPAIEVTRHRTTLRRHFIDVVISEDDPRVEVEACAADSLDPEEMMRVVQLVCTALQGNAAFNGYYDWKTVMHVVGTSFGPFCIDKKHYQKPRTMTADVLFTIARDVNSWAVTPKVDGTRRFIIAFNKKAYSVDVARNVSYEGCFSRDKVTVLDCEVVGSTYYVFDVPVFDSAYCGSISFDERMSLLDDILQGLDVSTVAKPYEKFGSFDKLQKLYGAFRSKYDMDGLIFVNTSVNYMQPVPKWKTHSTVDLDVVRNDSGATVLLTCDKHEVDVEHEELPDNSFGVWEFAFENGKLIAKRPRPDKPQANSKHIVHKNMFDSVPGTLFSGRGFYLMRKYHNRVKRQVIKDARDVKATFLDVGTGQGGDLRKWDRALRVFCVEPNHDSMLEMRDRCTDAIWSKITPINARLACVNPDLIDRKIDIFTAFFCMNQFENDDWKMLERLVKTRGSKNCRLLAIAVTSPKEHKSPNLELKMLGDDKYNIKMHDTRIMDIDEKTVSSSRMDIVMKRCDMKPVKQQKLDENDFMTADEKRLSSMYTLFIYARAN